MTVIKHRGVSLVELMIAMTLGLILLTGMIAVFSGNKRSSELNTAMTNLQENARFALSAIGSDIRMASYQGCLDPRSGSLAVKAVKTPVTIAGVLPSGGPMYNFNISSIAGAVVAQAHQWVPEIEGGFIPPVINPAIPGTHAIVMQFASKVDSELAGPVALAGIPSHAGTVVTTANLGFGVGDLAVISDCDNADLFAVSNAGIVGDGQWLEHKSPRNWDGNLTSIYGLPRKIAMTRISRFVSNIYYIGDTGLENEYGDKIRALYQQSYPYNDPQNPPSELVQGVENLRVSFGVKERNTLRYVTADDPLFRPELVESVQVGIIMTSYDRISEHKDKSEYVIAGQTIGPSTTSANGNTHAEDKRYRLVFNTTVKVRNRRSERIYMSQDNNNNQ